jgi:hypothetical protein
MAYETRQHFPTERIWITNEIIHNPSVNQRLKDMAVEFIEWTNGEKDFSVVGQGRCGDLPAFGASVQEMQLLNDKGCTIVDTTCPGSRKVWNTVEKHKKRDHTSIIHGKYNHEETVATSSFAGKYLVVLNLDQAQYVADYILNGGDKAEFMAKFATPAPPGSTPTPTSIASVSPTRPPCSRAKPSKLASSSSTPSSKSTVPRPSTTTSSASTPSATPPKNAKTPCLSWWMKSSTLWW